MLSRRPSKRIKDISGSVEASPETVRLRPPPKKLNSRQLDFDNGIHTCI